MIMYIQIIYDTNENKAESRVVLESYYYGDVFEDQISSCFANPPLNIPL